MCFRDINHMICHYEQYIIKMNVKITVYPQIVCLHCVDSGQSVSIGHQLIIGQFGNLYPSDCQSVITAGLRESKKMVVERSLPITLTVDQATLHD